MTDLHTRVLAELDRLQALAVGAIDAHGENWHVGLYYEDGYRVEVVGRPELVVAETCEETALHIAAWDPAAVLRLIGALREIADEHPFTAHRCDGDLDWNGCTPLRRVASALGLDLEEQP